MAVSIWEPLDLAPVTRLRRLLDMTSAPEDWIRVDEVREDGELMIRAEIPGIDPEKDVDVSVEDGILHIAARREQRSEEHDGFRSEFHYGEFMRDVRIPEGIDPSSISAHYEGGILEVRLPEAALATPEISRIPVEHS
jgi:HSP20 family protein